MKIRHLAACILATTIGAVPLAYSAPGGGTQVKQFRSTFDFAQGNLFDANVVSGFRAESHDDPNGVAQGYVEVYWNDFNTNQQASISCSGPEYAGALSVNQGNGNATVNATLDPSAPSCRSFNVVAPLAVSLSGQPDGSFSNSNRGTGTQQVGGTTFKFNFQSNSFGEAFTGSNGFVVNGTFSGSAAASRNNQRQRVE